MDALVHSLQVWLPIRRTSWTPRPGRGRVLSFPRGGCPLTEDRYRRQTRKRDRGCQGA